MHLLTKESLICQADESAPHLERCRANSTHAYKKQGGQHYVLVSMNVWREKEMCVCVCVCVLVGECLYSYRNLSAICPCIERLLLIKFSQAACLCLPFPQKGEMSNTEGEQSLLSFPIFLFLKGSTLHHILSMSRKWILWLSELDITRGYSKISINLAPVVKVSSGKTCVSHHVVRM